MAILVITYDTSTGGFKTQKVGSAQISDGAIVSGKIAANAIGGGHIASGWAPPPFGDDLNYGYYKGFKMGPLSLGQGTEERFYPCVAQESWDHFTSGYFVVRTPIPRTSPNMYVLRVHGYQYSPSAIVDFSLCAYNYGGNVGNRDNISGALTGIDLVDRGADKLTKYIGVSSGLSGYVQVALGPVDAYFMRLAADAWTTRQTPEFLSGWSIVNTITSGFGWGDIHTPSPAWITSSLIASGQVGIPHIYPEAVTSAKIAALAVGTPHLADLAVVSGKIVQSDISLALLGEKAHGSLTGVTAGQHHTEFTSGMHNFPHPSALIAALAIVSGKVASGGLSPLTSGKIWAGFTGNIAREENKPVGVQRASGSYAGDSVNDRAIAHGLGVEPKIVIIYSVTNPADNLENGFVVGAGNFSMNGNGAAVSDWDATDFHLAHDAGAVELNRIGRNYEWVALGW